MSNDQIATTNRVHRNCAVLTLRPYNDNSNGSFSYAEARTHGVAPVERGQPAYQHMRDSDGGGLVCER